MNSMILVACIAICLVAYTNADCATSCNQACATANEACNLLPVNSQCADLNTQCTSSCSTGCECLNKCEADCPAASPEDPVSVFKNAMCRVKCRNECEIELVSTSAQQHFAMAKTELAEIVGKVKTLVSATK